MVGREGWMSIMRGDVLSQEEMWLTVRCAGQEVYGIEKW